MLVTLTQQSKYRQKVSRHSLKFLRQLFGSSNISQRTRKEKELKKMVNMPMNLCAYATDKPNGFVTDINQNINQEYYEWLLKQHNYFPDCAFHKVSAKLCFSIDIDSEFFFLPVALNFRFIFRFILL